MTKSEAEKMSRASHQEWLVVSSLGVDPVVQRNLNMTWVRSKVPLFDPELLGLVVVNHRKDGTYKVIDGQHRVALIREVGWDDQQILCEVFERLTLVEEAKEFLGRNARISVRTFDKFRIRIAAAETGPCDIERIIRGLGLKLDEQKRDGAINAVAALERIYNGAGMVAKTTSPQALSKTLKTLRDSWGATASSFDGELIDGLGRVFLSFNGKIDEPALVTKLSKGKGGGAGIIGRAKSLRDLKGGTVAKCVGGVIVEMYNAGRRTGKLEGWWA